MDSDARQEVAPNGSEAIDSTLCLAGSWRRPEGTKFYKKSYWSLERAFDKPEEVEYLVKLIRVV